MSNKSRLQENNTNLQALIDKANALPDAGGGNSGTGTSSVTIEYNPSGWMTNIEVHYLTPDGFRTNEKLRESNIISVMNGFLIFYDSMGEEHLCEYSGGVTELVSNNGINTFNVTGDCSITIS